MLVCFVPASLAASDGIAPPVAGHSPDFDEPPKAPPHWLPAGKWVHLHWIPFDEVRLQQAAEERRTELWTLATAPRVVPRSSSPLIR